MLNRCNLHTYQEKAVDFICERKKVAAWLFLGAGKTVVTLTTISDLLDARIIKRPLIIGPIRVIQNVWRQEAAQWSHLKNLTFSIAMGTEKERWAGLNAKADIYMINREQIQWLVKACDKTWPFDCIVIDETTKVCRDWSGKRFKALKRTIPATNFMIQLTGTPGNLMSIFPQMYLLDKGDALGKYITGYRKEYFNVDFFGHTYTPKAEVGPVIYEKIDHLVLSMESSDYMELPELINLTQKTSLDSVLMEKYRTLKRDLLLKTTSGTIEATNAAVLSGKLQQFTSGFLYDDDKNIIHLHDAKLDLLEEIIEENENEQFIVAYFFQADLPKILKRFPHARTIKGPDDIANWNAGKIDMLCLHPSSDANGLNLQYNKKGATIIWYTSTWNLEDYTQLIGRLRRQNQTRPVRNISLVITGTIDEHICKAMIEKKSGEDEMIHALKKEFEE